MKTAFLKRTATAAIERRTEDAILRPRLYPTATVIELRDPASDREIAISPGTIFVKPGMPLPGSSGFRLKRFGRWNLVAGLDSFETAKRLGEQGWYLAFIVPAMQAFGFAFNARAAVQRALRRLTERVEERHFNAMEVASISVKTFLGITCARVAGHPRHLRDKPFVRDLNPHHRPSHRSSSAGIHHVVNQRLPERKAI